MFAIKFNKPFQKHIIRTIIILKNNGIAIQFFTSLKARVSSFINWKWCSCHDNGGFVTMKIVGNYPFIRLIMLLGRKNMLNDNSAFAIQQKLVWCQKHQKRSSNKIFYHLKWQKTDVCKALTKGYWNWISKLTSIHSGWFV